MPRFIPPFKRLIVSPFPRNRSPGLSVIYYGMIGMFRPGMSLGLFFRAQRRSKFTPRPKYVA